MRVIPVTASYAAPAARSLENRPALLAALGVISIVLAIAQGISALAWMGFSFGSVVTAHQLSRRAALAPVIANAPVRTEPADVAPDGLPDNQVHISLAGLLRKHPMSMKRQEHVRRLLRHRGRKVLPFAENASLSAARVAAQVTASGSLAGSADFYEFGRGRLEVNDLHAVFRADNGEVYRSSDAVVDRALSEDEIAQVKRALISLTGRKVSPAQFTALEIALRDPSQRLLQRSETPALAGRVHDGTIWMITSGGQIRLSVDGKITQLSATAPLPGTNPATGRQISSFWAGMALLDVLLTGVLAVMLLIAAIFLLRGRPVGRRMHVWWAWIKLPLALLGSVVCGLAVTEWSGMTMDRATSSQIALTGWVTGLLLAVGGALYPLVVLVAMNRPRIRAYFDSVV